jgi:hypothetical protein
VCTPVHERRKYDLNSCLLPDHSNLVVVKCDKRCNVTHHRGNGGPETLVVSFFLELS